MYQEKKIISTPISNNRLNFDERGNRTIVVPSLIEGTFDDIVIGTETVIEAEIGGKIIAGKGLKNFIFLKNAQVPTWICDNHNHAFAFWHEAYWKGCIQKGSLLVHIDQHTDLATPTEMPKQSTKYKVQNNGSCSSSSDKRNHCATGLSEDPGIQKNKLSQSETYNSSGLDSTSRSQARLAGMTDYPFETLEEVEDYTNSVLTIADFIVPALTTGLIKEVLMVTGEDVAGAGIFSWEDQLKKNDSTNILARIEDYPSIVVDIDLDYFAQGFDETKTFEITKYWIEKADIITIATSPLFIAQEKALSILKSLQKNLVAL